MNIEQAVQNLEDIKSKYTWSIGADGALDMAISALRAQNLQQTCNQLATNTIDRQVAIDAILREYNADDSDYPTDYQQGLHVAKKIIEQLPSAQPYLQQTCNQLATDTIYRQAAIDAFEDTTFTKNEVRRRLLEVPPAQPVHNTGKWVRGTYHGFGIYNWTCKCGHVVVAPVPDRFCGACGCDNAERRTDG